MYDLNIFFEFVQSLITFRVETQITKEGFTQIQLLRISTHFA